MKSNETMSAEKEPAPVTSTNAPPKYSRYRSVRRAQQQPEAQIQPEPEVKKDHDAGIARSMSRYRRSRVVPHSDQTPASPPMPPLPTNRIQHSQSVTVNSRLGRDPYLASAGTEVKRSATDPVHGAQNQQRASKDRTAAGPGRYKETEAERRLRKAKESIEREAERQRMMKEREEFDRQERIAEKQRMAAEAEQARLEFEESKRILAEQKRKDLERLEAELEAAAPRVVSPSKEKFTFFSRKKGTTKSTPPDSARSGGSLNGSSSLSRTRTKSNETPQRAGPRPVEPSQPVESFRVLERPKVPEQGIGQGGGGIVPQIDAPISASNAGERRILIRCKQSSINLPITPETTPVDIVYSAANIMTQNISTSTAILLESYTQLGLERRVRRYEHIRDIMNSWDRDTQNALVLQNSDSPNFDGDLETYSVPREVPADVSVYMYHSQKPGKWNKRHITLLSTGQIFMSKKPGAKMSDKDVVTLCHLTDFDIYTITPPQLRKVLKPPKKHCYAIKSQQKTSMFLSTENFVHFFSTDDEDLSEKWYGAVQGWRSWYLVRRLGEGRAVTKSKSTTELATELPARPGTRGGPTHRVKVSVDENPYTIGSFTPLINMDRFEQPKSKDEDEYDSEEENRPRQIPFHLRNSVSLSPMPSRRDSKRHPPPVAYRLPPEAEDEFAFSGLLGRSYSQRQRVQREREAALTHISGPFVDGPSLLNGAGSGTGVGHRRSLSVKSTKRPETSAGGSSNSGGLQKSTTQSQKLKPLLDFTTQFKEAPQWDKTGKGHGVKAADGVPLVEAATGPEIDLPGMPGTVFRRDTAARPSTAAKSGEGAFVKGGLVSGV